MVGTTVGVAWSQTLPGHHQPYDAIVVTLIFVTAWVVGTLSHRRRAALAAAASRAERAEASLDEAAARAAAAERVRIARELHDVVSHHVSLMAVQAEAVGALLVDNALIDGEAVVFLPDGHSDFARLRTRAGGEQASFVAFDLLSLGADDLRQRPLEERRGALAQLVAGANGVRFSEAIDAVGAVVLAHACKLGLEGIVSKRLGSRYRSGPSRNWLKCLNPEFQRR